MAYVLGLIYADGAVEDVRKSSRTCYVTLTSKDESLLEQVKDLLSSTHKLYRNKQQLRRFRNGKFYLCKENFILRIGNKILYQDLVNLGLKPRKSLVMSLPNVSPRYFNYFLRGYFDGDGCISVSYIKGQKGPRLKTIFTGGSRVFLNSLSLKLNALIGTTPKKVYRNGYAFRLGYGKKDSMNLLLYMYKKLNGVPYLRRKHEIYRKFLAN